MEIIIDSKLILLPSTRRKPILVYTILYHLGSNLSSNMASDAGRGNPQDAGIATGDTSLILLHGGGSSVCNQSN